MAQEQLWSGFFARHYSDNAIARRMFASCGVTSRHTVVDPGVEDASTWTTAERMRRYVPEATALGAVAARHALEASGVAASDIGMLVVVSCTGYATPGVDIQVAERLQLAPSARRLFVGHMGCHAALPALDVVSDFVRTAGRPGLLLSVELTSVHLQGPTDDVEQFVAHSLFGDAAAALVVTPEEAPKGIEVVGSASVIDTARAGMMTWDVTDHGFRMGLSSRLPDVLAEHVEPLVSRLLRSHGLQTSEVAAWAVHPGGPRILDVVQQQLGLSSEALETSRQVLDRHGNCSSATVMLVLEQARQSLRQGDHAVALAFGPGLTLYATVLRAI